MIFEPHPDSGARVARWRAEAHSNDRAKCPVRDVLSQLGDAWSSLVILILAERPMRFNALKREIGDVSQRMLAVTLRTLERDGLVSRTVFPTKPPQVEYALTDLGRSLKARVDGLVEWAEDNHGEIRRARTDYDAGAGGT